MDGPGGAGAAAVLRIIILKMMPASQEAGISSFKGSFKGPFKAPFQTAPTPTSPLPTPAPGYPFPWGLSIQTRR